MGALTVRVTTEATDRLGEPPKALMLALRDAFGVRCFLETGTHQGATAARASQHFEHVVTIEASETLYRAAVAAHGHLDNLRLVLGDTRSVLSGEVERLDGPAVVWLDSHWSGGERPLETLILGAASRSRRLRPRSNRPRRPAKAVRAKLTRTP
jgi:hypothetical protein